MADIIRIIELKKKNKWKLWLWHEPVQLELQDKERGVWP